MLNCIFIIKAFGELALLYNCARTATVKGELGFLNKIILFVIPVLFTKI